MKAVKLARKAKRLKQKDVARGAGISVSYLSLIERGKRSPTLSTLDKITQALNISSTTLFFLAAGEDGLENIDPVLSDRLVEYALARCRE